MRCVAGVVEVDSVLEVKLIEFLKGGSGVRQRTLKVNRADLRFEICMPHTSEGPGGPLDLSGDGVDSLKHLRHVAGRIAGVEQLVCGSEGQLHLGTKIRFLSDPLFDTG
ncbi:hypothetical protein PJL18_03958 [Paenarthrobacter nicotinovorans]|nr:hypothetical protein [Paenarthrobacter nicotinovorans]